MNMPWTQQHGRVAPWMETVSGTRVDLLTPSAEQIAWKDIAWGLSRQARYNGHTSGDHPYSVAQHSVWCAMVAQRYFKADIDSTRLVLFHDAHEAYSGDLITPLKHIEEIHRTVSQIEDRLQMVIHQAMDLPWANAEQADLIATVDNFALAVEVRHLLPPQQRSWGQQFVPTPIVETFRPAMPAMQAYELFWIADNYIRDGHDLADLWQDCA